MGHAKSINHNNSSVHCPTACAKIWYYGPSDLVANN